MIKRLREKENSTKQEGDTSNDDKFSTSSRLWLGLKDARIVRVPRAFGGKDRHCKVSTIRGLRDRRVRLSVQTAIQLYDLQDKLGVNQPSKVVDWLLNAAQHEIDKLPPLPFPPECFTHFCQSSPVSGDANPRAFPYQPTALENLAYTTQRNVKRTDELGDCHLALFSSKTNDEVLGNKVSELAKFPTFTLSSSIRRDAIEEGNSIRAIEAENDNVGSYCAHVSANVPLPRYNDSSLTGLGSNVIPCASYYHLEPANSNTYEHQLEGHSSKVEVPSFSVPSSLSLASGSQLVFYASGGMPSMFSPYMTTLNSLNSTQLNHFQTSASQNLQSSSVTFLQSGSPIMVRPSQPRLPSNHHNPYNHHGN